MSNISEEPSDGEMHKRLLDHDLLKRIEALVHERDEAAAYGSVKTDEVETLSMEKMALKDENSALRAALEHMLAHRGHAVVCLWLSKTECTCGYAKAKALLDEEAK